MGKTPEAVQAVVAVTSNNYWGIGENVVEALKNASVNLLAHYDGNHVVKVALSAYSCAGSKLSVSPMDGGVSYPSDATCINLGTFDVSELTTPADVLLASAGVVDKRLNKANPTSEYLEDLAYKIEDEALKAREKEKAKA